MWSAVIFDTILGGFVLGMISLLSNLYGKSSEYFYRILGFIWAVPLTLFIFVKMASRHGKNKIQDVCRHVIIGLVLTFLLALSIIYMVDFNNEIIVIYTFVSAILLTLCYFYFEIYKF